MNVLHATRIGAMLVAVTSSARAADSTEPGVLKGHTATVTALAWSADAKSIATASDDRTIRVWDAATGRQTAFQPKIARAGYGGPVVAFSSDLKTAAVNYWGEIRILDVESGAIRVKMDPILDRGEKSAFRPDVFAMAFRPDDQQLATAGSIAAVGGPHGLPGGIVITWDAATGKLIRKSAPLSTAPGALVWSSDGKWVAAGTNGAGGELPEAGQVMVWSAETGKVFREFHVKPEVEPGEWASAGDVAFYPSGKRIAAIVTGGSRSAPAGLLINQTAMSVRAWDIETGKATQLCGAMQSVRRLAFTPDGKHFATASGDETLRVWDIATGKEVIALSNANQVGVVAFSPDGKFLAAGCNDGSVRIWTMPDVQQADAE